MPYLDSQTPPLSDAGAALLLLLLPLAFLRLALTLAILAVYLLLLLLLQRRNKDADVPNFRLYPVLVSASALAAKAILAVLGFRLHVEGAEHARAAFAGKTATVVVSNHVSYLDVFACAAVMGPYFPVTRADVGQWPFFGAMLRLWGAQTVDRSREGGATANGGGVTDLMTARARRTDCWRKHPPMLVFPEGTCSTGDALLRFKSGCFVAGVPVLPLLLRYRCGALNAGWVWRERPTRSRVFRGWPVELVHLARLLVQRNKQLTVTLLPPYTPSPAERADPALFAANVRRAMAASLGVQQQEGASLDDARAYYAQRIKGYAKSA